MTVIRLCMLSSNIKGTLGIQQWLLPT